jgi:hypothetical protein
VSASVADGGGCATVGLCRVGVDGGGRARSVMVEERSGRVGCGRGRPELSLPAVARRWERWGRRGHCRRGEEG